MSNGNQQRCCLLGVCCPPGSAAQRAALLAWITQKIQESHFSTVSEDEKATTATVNKWLDELPWKEEGE